MEHDNLNLVNEMSGNDINNSEVFHAMRARKAVLKAEADAAFLARCQEENERRLGMNAERSNQY